MSERVYAGRPQPKSEASITTFEGLKRETNTAVIQYFAPVVALYNTVAATAGLPIVRWQIRLEKDQTYRRE
jgi:hypothetical protein